MWNLIAIDIVCLVCDDCCCTPFWERRISLRIRTHNVRIARDFMWLALTHTHQNTMKFYINSKSNIKEWTSEEEKKNGKEKIATQWIWNTDGMCVYIGWTNVYQMCMCVCESVFLIKTSPNRLNFTHLCTVTQIEWHARERVRSF